MLDIPYKDDDIPWICGEMEKALWEVTRWSFSVDDETWFEHRDSVSEHRDSVSEHRDSVSERTVGWKTWRKTEIEDVKNNVIIWSCAMFDGRSAVARNIDVALRRWAKDAKLTSFRVDYELFDDHSVMFTKNKGLVRCSF
nr:hypothetical protein TetV2_00229 [Oceanusvirus sp.]